MRVTAAAARKLGLSVPKSPRLAKTASDKLNQVTAFTFLCRQHGLPMPVAEFQFCPGRRWKFDWTWMAQGVVLEIEGGAWTGGRHTRGKGFLGDMDKYNEAAISGFKLLRCVPGDVKSGKVFQLLKRVLG